MHGDKKNEKKLDKTFSIKKYNVKGFFMG